MKELTLIRQNGGAFIDSREVADLIGKAHKNLLRDIAGYIGHMEKPTKLNFEPSEFFAESTYTDSTGRTLPCYLLTKMGCEMVANKLTGEKGVLFTAAYVKKFNEMEQYTLASPRLGEYNAFVRIVIRALRNVGASPESVYRFIQSVYAPLGFAIEAASGDAAETMYTAKEIAAKLGVLSMTGKPHAQAVSCIINENLFISEEHRSAITTDYGDHINVCVRYDEYAASAVEQWLNEYGKPSEVYGFERTYYVRYAA